MSAHALTATKKKQQSAEKLVLELRIYLKSLWLRIPAKDFNIHMPRLISFTDEQVGELYDMATKGEK